jgi:hypothetical protein
VPPDTEPPLLEVTWPTEAEHVDKRVIRFTGRTELEATVVAAGRYKAVVDASGSWSIALVLNPGGNVATFTATDPAGNTVEQRRAVFYDPPLVLRHDGLGVVSFGESVDTVIAVLTDLLGPPDWEEIQISADIDRSVSWDNPDLYLQFTYWDYFGAAPGDPLDPMPEGPVFHYYLTRSTLLATENGLTPSSTVVDLEAAYPDVWFEMYCGGNLPEFLVNHASGQGLYRLFGLLDGDPGDATTRIVYIGSGYDRTPC